MLLFQSPGHPTYKRSGWDAIFMYDINDDGSADLLSINLSPEVGDGPRNSFPSEDGKLLYVVRIIIAHHPRHA